MSIPTPVVFEPEWRRAREALLVKEKELTRARDALAAERRRLPMVPVEKDYRFAGPDGEVRLLDLFDGRRQLIVYVEVGREVVGRRVPGPEYWGINVFLRDGDQIYRSYFATGRAAEDLSSVWGLLDVTPFGREEEWQDAPKGVPQDPAYSWARRHDEYRPEELAGGRA
jgi:predicted dithiol-disulfide oxidoreductase (DUF899 family)